MLMGGFLVGDLMIVMLEIWVGSWVCCIWFGE